MNIDGLNEGMCGAFKQKKWKEMYKIFFYWTKASNGSKNIISTKFCFLSVVFEGGNSKY